MTATVPIIDAEPARTKRASESAKLDMIATYLRSSSLQIAIASIALTFAFDSRVTGHGQPTSQAQWVWLGAQFLIAAAFLIVPSLWPRGSDVRYGLRRRHALIGLYLISGACWGALTWTAIIPGDLLNQVLVMFVLMSVSVLYVVRLAPHVPVFMAAAGGMYLVALPNSWVLDNGLSTVLRFALPAWVAMLYLSASRLSRQITDMIEMRLREKELSSRLAEAHARAEAESASKSAFLANMSHELRTPLNAIIGFSDVMRQELFGALDTRYRAYSDDIHGSGEHLLSLINDVLDIAKIEAGQMRLAIEPVDTIDIAPQVVRLLQPRADAKRQILTLTLDGAPEMMLADPRALKQILLNVAGNAVTYTQPGGAIDISIRAAGRDVTLVVSDNGPGIPAEKLSKLFKPFERLDNTYLAAGSGTGLGLSLVQALTGLHGGEVALDSTLGQGTRVTIRLPGAVIDSVKAAAA